MDNDLATAQPYSPRSLSQGGVVLWGAGRAGRSALVCSRAKGRRLGEEKNGCRRRAHAFGNSGGVRRRFFRRGRQSERKRERVKTVGREGECVALRREREREQRWASSSICIELTMHFAKSVGLLSLCLDPVDAAAVVVEVGDGGLEGAALLEGEVVFVEPQSGASVFYAVVAVFLDVIVEESLGEEAQGDLALARAREERDGVEDLLGRHEDVEDACARHTVSICVSYQSTRTSSLESFQDPIRTLGTVPTHSSTCPL